jgi:hypothetical protein
VLADRPLAQVQRGGGPLEAAGVSHGDEAAQRRYVQGTGHVNHFILLYLSEYTTINQPT